jgi:dephospho-CoA kinase
MHPKIREVALSQIKGQPDNVIVVYDMPLLVETGSENLCDLVVVVTAPVEQRISRLTASRSMSIADIQQRIAQQSPDSVRVKAADFIITNQGSLEDLYAQCKPVWALILDAAHQSTRRTLS